MDTIIYKSIYRMEGIYAEGYIILNDGYVEGIFMNDYMAIYSNDGNGIIIELYALNVEDTLAAGISVRIDDFYQFFLGEKELFPNNSFTFYSDDRSDSLELFISAETVEGEKATYLAEELLPKLRVGLL